MKKTFSLIHPKIKPARMVDSIKHEVKKYLKRERNKALPDDADFWDFDCQFGNVEAEATEVKVSAINKLIDGAVAQGLTSFYVEILARPATKEIKDLDIEFQNEFDEIDEE